MAKRTKLALLKRLDSALQDLYHNATPNHPYNLIEDKDFDQYEDYFELAARQEIEYIQDGLGCTKEYWKKQQKLGFSHNERYYWLVQRITEFGKLYQGGRGGRTLAPNNLINMRGGSSFSLACADNFDNRSNADLTDMIQVIEAFNAYVKRWNSKENLTEMWKEELNCRKEIC